jgi:hypothetical protein
MADPDPRVSEWAKATKTCRFCTNDDARLIERIGDYLRCDVCSKTWKACIQ